MRQPRRAGGALSTVGAVVLATLVHVLTLAVAALGVAFVWPDTSIFQKIVGVGCFLLAYTLRPALGEAQTDGTRLDLKRSPETAALIRELASALGSAHPTRVEITSDARADLRLTGLHGSVLSVGVPLWLALTGPERVALLGHQLGHLAHGDLLVRRYVDGAVQTLWRWEGFLAPYRPGFAVDPQDQMLAIGSGSDAVGQNAMNGLLSDIVSILLWPVRVVVTGYRRAVEVLAAPSRERSALHSDAAAVRVAGTDATVALLEVMLALPAVETSANRAVATRGDVSAAITARMAAFDAGQRRALRRGDPSEAVEGHPSTLERLRVVESAVRVEPAILVGRERWAAVDGELSGPVAKQLKRLGDDYLYGH